MSDIKRIDLIEFSKNIEVIGEKGKFSFPLKYESIGNKVKFWYETRGGRFEPEPIVLPRFIPMDSTTFEVFGLIQAEATKVNYTIFDFSNSDPGLIKLVVDYFEKIWFIPKELWKCEVFYWKGFVNEKLRERLKLFWSELLRISQNQIKIREGTSYRLSEKSKSKYGVMSLRLPNKVFRSIVIYLLNYFMKTLAEKNCDLIGSFFRGLMSGDGTIVLRKNSIEYVSIAFNPNSSELEDYVKLLNVLSIVPNQSSLEQRERKSIQITNWKNFYQILKITTNRPFISEQKNIKFYKGFLGNQYVKSLLRLEEISKFKEITVNDYSKMFRVCERTANKSLVRIVNLNFFTRYRKSQKYVYIMSSEGKKFLNIIKYLKTKIGGDKSNR